VHSLGVYDENVCSMDVCNVDVHGVEALRGSACAWHWRARVDVGMQKTCSFFRGKKLIFDTHLKKANSCPLNHFMQMKM
jgi:hypothetical protein